MNTPSVLNIRTNADYTAALTLRDDFLMSLDSSRRPCEVAQSLAILNRAIEKFQHNRQINGFN